MRLGLVERFSSRARTNTRATAFADRSDSLKKRRAASLVCAEARIVHPPVEARAAKDSPGFTASRSNVLRVAEQVPAICDVLDAIDRRNWTRLRRLLHPDIHWTTAVEEQLHGASEVIARLSGDPPPAPPSYHEVRDGLMYR